VTANLKNQQVKILLIYLTKDVIPDIFLKETLMNSRLGNELIKIRHG
jgi:hypothetical protein